MGRYLLYYAGMADDKVTEQVGLAVSSDGVAFERAGSDGLILPVSRSCPWRSLRTCNPHVLQEDGGYLMLYQGIDDSALQQTSIGTARSRNGIDWDAADEPALPWQRLAEADSAHEASGRTGVAEPCALRENGRLRIWFVYVQPSHPGNALFYAESSTGDEWDVADVPVLTGGQFGAYDLHYPQVVRGADGYELWFTLRDDGRGVDGIFRMTSPDAHAWTGLEQVLPHGRGRIDLRWRSALPIRLPGKLDSFGVRAAVRLFGGRKALGYAHPHVMDQPGGRVMYYHRSNVAPRGRWHDIGRCELRGGADKAHVSVLAPRPEGEHWDGYFVADPFVLAEP